MVVRKAGECLGWVDAKIKIGGGHLSRAAYCSLRRKLILRNKIYFLSHNRNVKFLAHKFGDPARIFEALQGSIGILLDYNDYNDTYL